MGTAISPTPPKGFELRPPSLAGGDGNESASSHCRLFCLRQTKQSGLYATHSAIRAASDTLPNNGPHRCPVTGSATKVPLITPHDANSPTHLTPLATRLRRFLRLQPAIPVSMGNVLVASHLPVASLLPLTRSHTHLVLQDLCADFQFPNPVTFG